MDDLEKIGLTKSLPEEKPKLSSGEPPAMPRLRVSADIFRYDGWALEPLMLQPEQALR